MKAIDRKAYELAKRVLEAVDWKNCDERRVLVVELKDGRRRFVSFLGSEGCFRAVSLFADAAGFARLAMAEIRMAAKCGRSRRMLMRKEIAMPCRPLAIFWPWTARLSGCMIERRRS